MYAALRVKLSPYRRAVLNLHWIGFGFFWIREIIDFSRCRRENKQSFEFFLRQAPKGRN